MIQKAKLIKTKEGYNLYSEQPQGRILEANLTGVEQSILGKATLSVKKISLKNCQAIERGYDLDELFESIPRNLTDESNDYWKVKAGFEVGFQTALEILGDKKFAENDMIKVSEFAKITAKTDPHITPKELVNSFIQLSQQTEWDVEVVMEKVYDGLDEMAQPQYSKQPKLDSDNCLILKRI